jgi:hypothetical protein
VFARASAFQLTATPPLLAHMSASLGDPRGRVAFAALKPLCVPLVDAKVPTAHLLAHISSLTQALPTLDPVGVRACFQYVLFPLTHLLRASTEPVRLGALRAVNALVQQTGVDTREKFVELVLLLLDLITQLGRPSVPNEALAAVPPSEELHELIWTTLDGIVQQALRLADIRDLMQHEDFRVTLGFLYVLPDWLCDCQ